MEDRKTNSDTDKLSLPLSRMMLLLFLISFFFLKINLTMHYT